MLIGVPKEIKQREYRVGMTPGAVREAVAHGSSVLVETNAGGAIDLPDDAYRAAGAAIAPDAASVWRDAEMVVKVKEPLPAEYALLRRDQVLFTYLHLAADKTQAETLIAANNIAIA
ncbi:MAG: alanine dehydrogenase, partial [Stellaceae bacterium]